MKKLLSTLMALMLLPMALCAMTLEPNQRIMGHYTTDDYNEAGWGKSFLKGANTIATDITADELAVFQGSKIVAFRIGLAEVAPVSRVFVIPVDANGKPTDEITEWECNVSNIGWNLVELGTPYRVNLPEGYSLRIGFDYEQTAGTSKPLSAVKIGTIYPSLHYRNGKWLNYGVNTYGNLSLQCITENDNYPQYIVRLGNINCKSNAKIGDEIPYSFQIRNLGEGTLAAGDVTFDVAVDGTVVNTISNATALSFDFSTTPGAISTEGLAEGTHTLSITVSSIKGQPVENPATLTTTFKLFEFGFSRQMRLVEQFTSTGCTYCPQGSANVQALCDLRGDIAWVSIHENMGNQDPFRTSQTDSITDLQGIDGFPEGTFDRTVGLENNNHAYAVLTALSPSTMSSFLDHIAETPSWATVNINSTFDEASREAVITIDGELVPTYEDMMGTDSKLTVYITEDGLVAPQVSGGNDYVHNNVLRQALVSVKGVDLKKNGNTYKNEFTVTIPAEWNADNLNIVAFVSRPLGLVTDMAVTNANKRKFGEFDEPTTLPGDVDGNGIINIDDVTTLIDALLSGQPTAAGADVDANGNVNIDDVTVLIDKLLSGN